MKKVVYEIGAFNEKQLRLFAVCDNLRFFKYVESDKNGPIGGLFDCPITGKTLCIKWKVESYEIVKKIMFTVWGMLLDEVANRNINDMIRLGYMKKNS